MAMFDPNQSFAAQTSQEDFGTSQENLGRRKKLLDALTQQSMGSAVVGGSKAASIGQGLLKVLTAYLTDSKGKELATEQGELAQRQRADLMQQVDSYTAKRDGKAGEVMSDADALNLMQNDVAPNLAEPVKADPRRAVLEAMTSQHPELQAIGKADTAAMAAAAANAKGFKDLIAPDGSLLRSYNDGRPVEKLGNYAKPGERWSDPYEVRGADGKPLMVKRNLTTNEVDVVDKAPKVTANANASASSATAKGETEFAKTLGKDVAGEFKAARENAKNAYKAKSFVNQMQKLEESGMFSGPTANIATTLSSIGQVLGLPVDEAKLANSQAFQQQFAAQVANVLTMGGGIGKSMTDADRKAFEQSLPTVLMSPQGRAQVYQMLNSQADQDIARAKSFQQQLSSNPMYGDAAGLLTLNPVDESPMGAAGGVSPPGGAPLPGIPTSGSAPTGQKLKVIKWD